MLSVEHCTTSQDYLTNRKYWSLELPAYVGDREINHYNIIYNII